MTSVDDKLTPEQRAAFEHEFGLRGTRASKMAIYRDALEHYLALEPAERRRGKHNNPARGRKPA